MATTRIEYGARYPKQLGGDEYVIEKNSDREEAEGLVRFVNSRLKASGYEESASLYEREVVVGDWRPANTGIVPPFITERIKEE